MKTYLRLVLISLISLYGANSSAQCVMDMYTENNLSTTVPFVNLSNSSYSSTFTNLLPNGGSGDLDNSYFEWSSTEGFSLGVRIPANSGTGSIRISFDNTLIECIPIVNSSMAITYYTLTDFTGLSCPGAIYIIIQPLSCP